MEPTTIKLLAPITLVGAVLAPTGLYKASDAYIRLYHRGAAYYDEVKTNMLSKVGLTTIKDDGSIDTYIDTYANKYGVNPKLIHAMITQESAKNSDAYSIKGAIGLMQIMPGNSRRCGLTKVSKLWDEETNIRCGVQIISEELITYKGNVYTALRGYNGSPQAVKSDNPATHRYAREVIQRFAQLAYAN